MDESPQESQEYIPHPFRLTGTGEEYDALAELFLGDEPAAAATAVEARVPDAERASEPYQDEARVTLQHERSAPPSPEAEHAATVEGLVLGHLPMRASIWVRQYAASVAESLERPVALVRAGAVDTSVEVIGRLDDGTPGIELIRRVARSPEASSLGEAVRAASRVCARWIIRVDEPSEPEMAEHPGVDDLTMLTGADEAAVVASYRLMKSLAAGAERREDAGHGAPGLRVAIMGATSDQGVAAGERLERASQTFLERKIRIVARVPRIGTFPSVTLFRSDEHTPADRLLRVLSGEDESPEPSVPASPASPPVLAPGPKVEVPGPEACAGRIGPPEADTTPAAQPVRRERSLASFVGGLEVLEARCPFAPGVELACDTDGRLHVLADETGEGFEGDGLGPLTAVGAWATQHADLLRRSEPGLRAWRGAPALHLFTSDPKRVRRLLDADVRVHLLARVALDGRAAWFTRELN